MRHRHIEALEHAVPRVDGPGGGDVLRETRLALEVRIDTAGTGQARAFTLFLGASDLLGYCAGPRPGGRGPRLTVPETALRAVDAGTATGTAAVMSSARLDDGTWSELAEARAATLGRRFTTYLTALCARRPPSEDTPTPEPRAPTTSELVAVLAAPNHADGSLSPMAADRSREAIRLRSARAATLVLTGGFGGQFNTTGVPHWRHCLRWLRSNDLLAPPVIALETRHTYDDALFLREVARAHPTGAITVVTSDYHADRVRYILRLVLPEARVRTVRHPSLSSDAWERLRAHEARALGKTVAATVVFGPDRLPAPLDRVAIDVGERWRP